MKEICIPITHFGDQDIAEVTVKVGGKKLSYNFRVESFPWHSEEDLSLEDEISQSLTRITRLKKAIKQYNEGWELIQIFTPLENASHIQVLYRKKEE